MGSKLSGAYPDKNLVKGTFMQSVNFNKVGKERWVFYSTLPRHRKYPWNWAVPKLVISIQDIINFCSIQSLARE